MNNFITKYEKFLEILKQFETKSNFLNQIRCTRLSDIELIALDLTAESLSVDSEYQLFRILPSSLSSKIERSVYNRRRRKLFFVKERIRKALAEKLTNNENYFLTLTLGWRKLILCPENCINGIKTIFYFQIFNSHELNFNLGGALSKSGVTF